MAYGAVCGWTGHGSQSSFPKLRCSSKKVCTDESWHEARACPKSGLNDSSSTISGGSVGRKQPLSWQLSTSKAISLRTVSTSELAHPVQETLWSGWRLGARRGKSDSPCASFMHWRRRRHLAALRSSSSSSSSCSSRSTSNSRLL